MTMQLSGIQKIAVLFAVLGEDGAAKVMGTFQADEQERIGQAMVELEELELEDEVVSAVIDEFRSLLASGVVFRSHLGKTLQGVMSRLHGEQDGGAHLERIRDEARSRFPFRGLRGVRAKDLARVLADEHEQIQALVLVNLNPDQAAGVLGEIPEQVRPGIVSRMATMEEPSARLLKQVAQTLVERTRGLRREDETTGGEEEARFRAVADILNATEAGADKVILESIEEEDQALSSNIRDRMFTWADLSSLDKRTMQKVLAGIDTKLLAMALKSCDEAVAEGLLGATSQRTRDMIQEERELLGAVPLSEVLDSQKQILLTVRDLMDSGEVTVSKGGTALVS